MTEFIITSLSARLHLSTLNTDLVSTFDRHNTQWEGPLGRDRGGSEHWGIQAEREHFGNSRNLHNNEGEDGGCSDPGEPNQVPQEKEEEVSHTVILEKEQEKEGWEGKNRSLRAFTVLLGKHLNCLVNCQLDEGNWNKRDDYYLVRVSQDGVVFHILHIPSHSQLLFHASAFPRCASRG